MCWPQSVLPFESRFEGLGFSDYISERIPRSKALSLDLSLDLRLLGKDLRYSFKQNTASRDIISPVQGNNISDHICPAEGKLEIALRFISIQNQLKHLPREQLIQ